ncbi:hypothetical protein [Pseudonocardia sp.]|jgi:hypothetical protein|uniref:hypothetical protein n=1 Tax=Pseudonocardia sp. TaxID=60912 RepID=UPI0031FE290C
MDGGYGGEAVVAEWRGGASSTCGGHRELQPYWRHERPAPCPACATRPTDTPTPTLTQYEEKTVDDQTPTEANRCIDPLAALIAMFGADEVVVLRPGAEPASNVRPVMTPHG